MLRSVKTPIGLSRRRDRPHGTGVKRTRLTIDGSASLMLDTSTIPTRLLAELRQVEDVESVHGGIQPNGWAYITVDNSLLVWDSYATFNDAPKGPLFQTLDQQHRFTMSSSLPSSAAIAASVGRISSSVGSGAHSLSSALDATNPVQDTDDDPAGFSGTQASAHGNLVSLVAAPNRRMTLAAVAVAHPLTGTMDIWVLDHSHSDMKTLSVQIPLDSDSPGQSDVIQSLSLLANSLSGAILLVTTQRAAGYLVYIDYTAASGPSARHSIELVPLAVKPDSSTGSRLLSKFRSVVSSLGSVLPVFGGAATPSTKQIEGTSTISLAEGKYTCPSSAPMFQVKDIDSSELALISTCTVDDVVTESGVAVYSTPDWRSSDEHDRISKSVVFVSNFGIHIAPLTLDVDLSRSTPMQATADYIRSSEQKSGAPTRSHAPMNTFPSALMNPVSTINFAPASPSTLTITTSELGQLVETMLRGEPGDGVFSIHSAACTPRRIVLVCSLLGTSESTPLLVSLPGPNTLLSLFADRTAPSLVDLRQRLNLVDVSRLNQVVAPEEMANTVIVSSPTFAPNVASAITATSEGDEFGHAELTVRPSAPTMRSPVHRGWATAKPALIDTPSPYVLANTEAAPLVPLLFLSIGDSVLAVHPALVDPSAVTLLQIHAAASEPVAMLSLGALRPFSLTARPTVSSIRTAAKVSAGESTAAATSSATVVSDGFELATAAATCILLTPSGSLAAVRCVHADADISMTSALSQQLQAAAADLSSHSELAMGSYDPNTPDAPAKLPLRGDKGELEASQGLAAMSLTEGATWGLSPDNPLELPFRAFLRSAASSESLSTILSQIRTQEALDYKILGSDSQAIESEDTKRSEVDMDIDRLVSTADICSREPTLLLPAWPPRPAAAFSEGRITQWALVLRRSLPQGDALLLPLEEGAEGGSEQGESASSGTAWSVRPSACFGNAFGHLPSLSLTPSAQSEAQPDIQLPSKSYHPPTQLDAIVVSFSKSIVDATPGHVAALERTHYSTAFDIRALTSSLQVHTDIVAAALASLRNLTSDPLMRSLCVKRRVHYDFLRFLVTPAILAPENATAILTRSVQYHTHPIDKAALVGLADSIRPVSIWSLLSSNARQAVIMHAQQICVAASLRSFFTAACSPSSTVQDDKTVRTKAMASYYQELLREAIRVCVETSVAGNTTAQAAINSMMQRQGLTLVDVFFSMVSSCSALMLRVLADAVAAAQRGVPTLLAELFSTTYAPPDPDEDVDLELLGGANCSSPGSARVVRAVLSSFAFKFNAAMETFGVSGPIVSADQLGQPLPTESWTTTLAKQDSALGDSNRAIAVANPELLAECLGSFTLKSRLPALPTTIESTAFDNAVDAVRSFTLASTLALTVSHVVQQSAGTALDEIIVRFGDADGNFIPLGYDREKTEREYDLFSESPEDLPRELPRQRTLSASVRIFKARILRHPDSSLRTRHAPQLALTFDQYAPPPSFGCSSEMLTARFDIVQAAASATLWVASSLVLPFVQEPRVRPYCRSTVEMPSDAVLARAAASSPTSASSPLTTLFTSGEQQAICQTLFIGLFSQAKALTLDLCNYVARVGLIKRLHASSSSQALSPSSLSKAHFAINACEARALNAFQTIRRVLLMTVTAPLLGMEEAMLRIRRIGRALQLLDLPGMSQKQAATNSAPCPIPTASCSSSAAAALHLIYDGCARFTIEQAFQLAASTGDIESPILLTELEVHRATRLIRNLACVSARDFAITATEISKRRLNPLIARHGVAAAAALFDLYSNRTFSVLTLLPPPGPIALVEALNTICPGEAQSEIQSPLTRLNPDGVFSRAVSAYIQLSRQRLVGRLLFLGKEATKARIDREFDAALSASRAQNLADYSQHLAKFLRTGSTSAVLREAAKAAKAESMASYLPMLQTTTEQFASLSSLGASADTITEIAHVNRNSTTNGAAGDPSTDAVPNSPKLSALRLVEITTEWTDMLGPDSQEEKQEDPTAHAHMPVELSLHDILTTNNFGRASVTLVHIMDEAKRALKEDKGPVQSPEATLQLLSKSAHIYALAKLCGVLATADGAPQESQAQPESNLAMINHDFEITEVQSQLVQQGVQPDMAYTDARDSPVASSTAYMDLFHTSEASLTKFAKGTPLTSLELATVLIGAVRAELAKIDADQLLIEDWLWQATKVILLSATITPPDDPGLMAMHEILLADVFKLALAMEAPALFAKQQTSDQSVLDTVALQASLWARLAAALSVSDPTTRLADALKVTQKEIASAFIREESVETGGEVLKRTPIEDSMFSHFEEMIRRCIHRCLESLSEPDSTGPTRGNQNVCRIPPSAKSQLEDVFTRATQVL